ncbi:MAG: hypothetical protein ABSH47_12780 [Bryobacteraceae bacterium]|jgi:hypothetical protein
MTLSRDDLLANKALASRLIGEYCCSAAIGEEYEKKLPEFEPILPTTWKALADEGGVRSTLWHFQLTPQGWIKGLEAIGRLCDDQMKKDLGRLAAALKNRLNRTEGPAVVGTHEIVSETGLPHYWVVNVIHSHLIRHCLRRKDADWAEGDRMESLIEVPIDFDHPL